MAWDDKEYRRQYYAKNKKKMLVQQKIYRKRSWEHIKRKMWAWKFNNPMAYFAIAEKQKIKNKARVDAYRKRHPDLWRQLPNGRWQKLVPGRSKYFGENPEQRQARILAQRKADWLKHKADPAYIAAHRIRARDYARRKAAEKRKQKEASTEDKEQAEFTQAWMREEKLKLLNQNER